MQYVSNRYKDLFERNKYFGVRCTFNIFFQLTCYVFQGFKIRECVLDQERCHQNRYKLCMHHFISRGIAGENGEQACRGGKKKRKYPLPLSPIPALSPTPHPLSVLGLACKVYIRANVAHQAGAYPGFRSMKRLGVFLLPPGWHASPSQVYPPALSSPVPIYTPGWREAL